MSYSYRPSASSGARYLRIKMVFSLMSMKQIDCENTNSLCSCSNLKKISLQKEPYKCLRNMIPRMEYIEGRMSVLAQFFRYSY